MPYPLTTLQEKAVTQTFFDTRREKNLALRNLSHLSKIFLGFH